MKLCVLFITTFVSAAFVLAAPFEKAVPHENGQDEIELAKRAKEQIMFGNQQNPARVKKRDPEDATGESEIPQLNDIEAGTESGDSNVDLKGEVVAMPARETVQLGEVEREGDDENEEESSDVIKDIDEAAESVEDGDGKENTVDSDVKDMIESADTMKETNDEDQPEVESPLMPIPSNQNPENIADFYKYLMRYENLLKEAPYSRVLQQYPQSYYAYRRRRSILNKLGRGRFNSNKAVKRAKRIKRDLFEDATAEYYYPYLQESGLLDEPSYGDMEVYPESPEEADVDEGDLLAYLLSLYDNDGTEAQAYEVENPYERFMEEEPEEEPVYVPVKRQMLSNLPGMRKRYFYPFNKEPQTHWGAFVPQQKRDYLNAYDRVLRVARALANQEDYYPDIYDGYKKK